MYFEGAVLPLRVLETPVSSLAAREVSLRDEECVGLRGEESLDISSSLSRNALFLFSTGLIMALEVVGSESLEEWKVGVLSLMNDDSYSSSCSPCSTTVVVLWDAETSDSRGAVTECSSVY